MRADPTPEKGGDTNPSMRRQMKNFGRNLATWRPLISTPGQDYIVICKFPQSLNN